jgi:hypothetical protein
MRNGIVMQAFAALVMVLNPRCTTIVRSQSLRSASTKLPLKSYWPERCSAARLLSPHLRASPIEENFDISALPDNAIEEITQGISTRVRLNSVVDTASPGSFQGEDERSGRNFPLS